MMLSSVRPRTGFFLASGIIDYLVGSPTIMTPMLSAGRFAKLKNYRQFVNQFQIFMPFIYKAVTDHSPRRAREIKQITQVWRAARFIARLTT